MKVKSILVAILYLAYTQQLIKGQPLKDCKTRCGDVEVNYPFGISPSCYYAEDRSFLLTCTKEEKLIMDMYKGFPEDGSLAVTNISDVGQLRVMQPISYACFNDAGNLTNSHIRLFDVGNFSLSYNNSLTGVGCNGFVYMRGFGPQNSTSGCILDCTTLQGKKSCPGEGCCQIPVSKLRHNFYAVPQMFEVQKRSGNETLSNNTQCIYAFLVENGKLDLEDISSLKENDEFPIVLDWSIGEKTCGEVGSSNICGGNSKCSNSTTRPGYICTCLQGFVGNPYLSDGCQDINECTTTITIHRHNCSSSSTCENTIGHFRCKCPSGYDLNPTTNSCSRKPTPEYLRWTPILVGTVGGFLVLLLGAFCIKQRLKHHKDTKLRLQFFEQNGGGMLRQRLSGVGPSNVDIKIFTEEGMKTATDGYDKSRILGEGGQGTVYKGILPDKSIVAIKKARVGDSSQVEQFINEVLVLSQINHRNVVKLLGCCLETEVPLLVYEFITNGTLYDHLHCPMFDSSLTWEQRLRIIIEVAGTLAYLHSSASIPIIHRDIKTANILLDENLTAKVADFGASRLIPMDKEQLTTMVQGTLGYLDPEYYNTGLLNDKSDVYSFGVVLMEMLTSQKAMCFERPQYSKHLVSYFVSATKDNRLEEIIDGKLMNSNSKIEIEEVAKVGVWCTRVAGEERPKMKEVAAKLEALRVTTTKHGKLDQYPEPDRVEQLPGAHILSPRGDTSSSGYDSISIVPKLDIETGR